MILSGLYCVIVKFQLSNLCIIRSNYFQILYKIDTIILIFCTQNQKCIVSFIYLTPNQILLRKVLVLSQESHKESPHELYFKQNYLFLNGTNYSYGYSVIMSIFNIVFTNNNCHIVSHRVSETFGFDSWILLILILDLLFLYFSFKSSY